VERKEPWIQPCAGRSPAGVHFVTTIDVNINDAVERLTRKIKLFIQKIDQAFLYLVSKVICVPH
jgi:hypothetical protein